MTQQTMFDEHGSDVRAVDAATGEIGSDARATETAVAEEEETLTDDVEEMETAAGEVVDDGDPQTITVSSLYGDDADVAALAERVMLVAPWVDYKLDGKWHKMTTKEVSLVIRRSMALGVDPLNTHEVQIWRDRHGVQFQLAYTLMADWVRTMKGDHTEPRYIRLTAEERELEGLKPDDKATWCTFVMLSDIPNITALVEAGFEPQEARSHFTVRGLGTASAEDWAGRYFAPNGRSKRWKLRKRALVDAYRMRFGTPNREAIDTLRRQRGEQPLLPSDFDHIAGDLPYYQRLDLAHRHAARRNGIEELTERDQALPAQRTNRQVRSQLFKASADDSSGA